ncbi:MAG: hypothetical protein AUG51_00385 [Acidobacteria bacterium 13_1_20CM_3_53_8]|nr:MAG: hypothetical protein AUG51_00385 [Acidobacteria bacterium 13_1_20CM_3_53_8]
MPTEFAEIIFEKIKELPLEQQREVLQFIERLATEDIQSSGTIWEEIREIVKDVPNEVWEQLPRDGSLNVDHYLYGAPKK